MSTQMLVRLDSATKNKLATTARREGKNSSQVVRDLIEDYVRNRDMEAYVDDLWRRMGRKMQARKIGLNEIQHAVRQVRAAQK